MNSVTLYVGYNDNLMICYSLGDKNLISSICDTLANLLANPPPNPSDKKAVLEWKDSTPHDLRRMFTLTSSG
jgi:hypothetical protein